MWTVTSKNGMEKIMIKENFNQILPFIKKMEFNELNFSYDKEADVLYIRIGQRQKATRTDDSEYPVLYRYNKEELIGITIVNYSRR